MITMTALVEACTAVTDLVATLPDLDPDAPTPCDGFTLQELATHLTGTTSAFAIAGTTGALDPADPWGSGLPPQPAWRDRLTEHLRRTAEGWSDPQRWEGPVEHCPMPARGLGEMALIEIVVHGWDLAATAGRPWRLSAASAAETLRQVTATAELGRQMGVYGPAVEVGSDADDLDRALALTGRDPRWARPTDRASALASG